MCQYISINNLANLQGKFLQLANLPIHTFSASLVYRLAN